MFLDSIYQVIAKGPIVIVSFISTVALVGTFVWLGKDLPKIPGVVCLELAFSKERFRSIVAQWHEHGVLQTIKRGIWLDLFFALVYALFFSSLLAWSTIEPDEVPGPALIVFLSLPFAAGALDWVENLAHLYLLKGNDILSEPLIVLAATASFIKWLLVIVAFSTSVSLFVIHVIEIRISSEAAYQGMAEWQIAFVALVLTVTFLGFLRARGKSSVKAPGILCLQFAFTEKRFKSIIGQWREHGLVPVRKRGLEFDLLLPFMYVPFLASLFAWSTIKPDEDPGSALIFLFTLSFVAGALDWAENGLHLLWLLKDPDNCPQPLIFLASTAATTKWVFIAVSLLVSIYHLPGKLL